MLLSFLIPVYNTQKYLEKCMESLICQTGCDFEIVLLNDGSTDSSGAMCDRYAAEYPEIVRVIHKQNEGLLMTRRRGFAEARGDWFICVDSDDYVAPDLLEHVVETIRKTDADMVMYNFEYFNEQGAHTPSRLKLEDGKVYAGAEKRELYEKRLLAVDTNMMWMRAIKREIVDFETDYSTCGIRNMCEDALQVLPLYSNAEKIACIDRPLYYYRKGSDSITARMTVDNWKSSQICFSFSEKYLKLWNLSEEIQVRFYTQHLEHLCNYVRWLCSAKGSELPATLAEMIVRLKNAPDFIACRQNYCKKFAHSRYLSIVVPILTYFVSTENVRGIQTVLRLENRLLKIRGR